MNPSAHRDSLVLLFGNKTRMVIHTTDPGGIRALSAYDINKIIRDMGMKLDSSGKENAYLTVDENSTVRYLQDTLIVVTRKDGNVRVTIRESQNDDRSSEQNENRERENEDSGWRNRSRSFHKATSSSYFAIGLGLNTLVEQSSQPGYTTEQYELRPIGSRYVSLTLGQKATLARGRGASLRLYYGLEVAWNNFMFENNNTIVKNADRVEFPIVTESLDKSKLTVATIGIPVVPRVTFINRNGRRGGHIGLGGYVNYRIDSYARLKFDDGNKDRLRSNFHLNELRYGLIGQLGIAGVSLFVKYDLVPLFKENRGPDVRALSFGFTL